MVDSSPHPKTPLQDSLRERHQAQDALQSTLPVTPPPVIPPPNATLDLASTDVLCKQCGFNLRGLNTQGNCPECGSPIWRSIAGDLLRFSSPEYLAMLSRGLACILIAVIAQLVVTLLAVPIGIAIFLMQGGGTTGRTPGFTIVSSSTTVDLAMTLIGLPLTLLSLYGWWLFSGPDPGIKTGDRGDRPRANVRIATIVLLAATLLSGIAQTYAIMMPIFAVIFMGVSIVAIAAWLWQVFASLAYIRWLGRRFPDESLIKQSSQYMWLLPLIYLLGTCVLVGPIVATIMYFLFLNKVRRCLNTIHQRQHLGPRVT